jgi:integrase
MSMLDLALDEIVNLDLSDLHYGNRQIRLKDLREHQVSRNFALISHEAIALINAMSLPIEIGSGEFNILCDRLIRAEIELLQRQNERDFGNFCGEPTDPLLRAGKTKLDMRSLESIIDEQENRSRRGLGVKAASTFRKYRAIIKEFSEWRKSDRAASVTEEEVERWRDELIDEEYSPKTVRDKMSCIKSVLNWGQKLSGRSLFSDRSPLEALELPELDKPESSQLTYTVAQAETVLLASRERSLAYQRWVPWMLAYSGARVSEILQLTKEDFFKIGEYWFYHIKHGGERSTKTKKSRKVPVHPALIDEGLIGFVENAPKGNLFAEKRMDGNLRDWIRADVLPDLPKPKPGPNHGFRHLFEDLRYGSIDAEASNYITGRANKGSAAGYGKSDVMLPVLAKQMEQFPRFLGSCTK